MPYNIKIQDDQGRPLRGSLYMYNEQGEEIGEAGISEGGSDVSDGEITGAYHFKVTSPGYYYYGTSVLYETNTFTLNKKPQTALWVALAVAGGFALAKLVKLKL